MAMPRSCQRRCGKENIMLDVIFIAIGVGFFAIATLYIVACDRL